MHSHHSHSGSFCKHAAGTLEEVVLEAIKKGFKIYGLSEHVPRYRERDLYPEEKRFGVENLGKQFDAYVAEAQRLKEAYADKITLLVGAETDFITDLDYSALHSLLDKHGDHIEYLVGSVHHVNEQPIDFDRDTWQQCLSSFSAAPADGMDLDGLDEGEPPYTAYLSSYFDSQFTFMERFRPEVIGHFDLCRLYVPLMRLNNPKYEGVWAKVERNIDFAIGYGACFELNAAAFRKGWKDAYPGEDVLKLIISKGGRLCLSDDSHGPSAVGLNFHLLYDYMVRMGVRDLWYLERHDERNVAGRKVRAVQYNGDWQEDPFWSQFGPELERGL
ncbi:histidinolphosphatase [Tulasnella sp. 417]|nr:histidinolphosphatase [Tulasnella sp. 417]